MKPPSSVSRMGHTALQGPSLSKMHRGMRSIVLDKTLSTCAAVAIQPISPSAMGAMRRKGLWADVSRRYDRFPGTSCRPWHLWDRGHDEIQYMTESDLYTRATFSGGCFWCLQPPFLAMLLALCGSLSQDSLTRLVIPGDIFGGRYLSNLVSLEVLDSDTSA